MAKRALAALALGATVWPPLAHAMELTSPDVAADGQLALAQVYSDCGGGNVSPALSWSGAPSATKSYAVTMYDPDAKGGWWHWIVYAIPAPVHALARGGEPMPAGARLGHNDFGKAAYGGACPPPGSGPHHYQITVWALGTPTLPTEGATEGQMVGPYLQKYALASATLTAIYER